MQTGCASGTAFVECIEGGAADLLVIVPITEEGLLMSQPVILIVEDNPDEAQLLCEAFAEVAPEVVVVAVASAGDALAYLSGLGAGDWPRALVTDGHLPDFTGVQLIARIRTDPRAQAMVIVMLSGGMSAPSGLGNVDWYEKPLTWPAWCAWVSSLVVRLR